MLLSPFPFDGTGRFGLARESQKAHLQITFQLLIPVLRLSVISTSRDLCETLMLSSGGFIIPKITWIDFRGSTFFVELKLVISSDKALEML